MKKNAKVAWVTFLLLAVLPGFATKFYATCSHTSGAACSLLIPRDSSIGIYFPSAYEQLLKDYFAVYSESGRIYGFDAGEEIKNRLVIVETPEFCKTFWAFNGSEIFQGKELSRLYFFNLTGRKFLFLCNITVPANPAATETLNLTHIFNTSVVYFNGNFSVNTTEVSGSFNYTYDFKEIFLANFTSFNFSGMKENISFCYRLLNNTLRCISFGNITMETTTPLIPVNLTIPVLEKNQTGFLLFTGVNTTVTSWLFAGPEDLMPPHINVSINSSCRLHLNLLGRDALLIELEDPGDGCTIETTGNTTFNEIKVGLLKPSGAPSEEYLCNEYISPEDFCMHDLGIKLCRFKDVRVLIDTASGSAKIQNKSFGKWRDVAEIGGQFFSCWINSTGGVFLGNSSGVYSFQNNKLLKVFDAAEFTPLELFYNGSLLGFNGTDYAFLTQAGAEEVENPYFSLNGLITSLNQSRGNSTFTCLFPGHICSSKDFGTFSLPLQKIGGVKILGAKNNRVYLKINSTEYEIIHGNFAQTFEVLNFSSENITASKLKFRVFYISNETSGVLNMSFLIPADYGTLRTVCSPQFAVTTEIYGAGIKRTLKVTVKNTETNITCEAKPVSSTPGRFLPITEAPEYFNSSFVFRILIDEKKPVIKGVNCPKTAVDGRSFWCNLTYTDDTEILNVTLNSTSVVKLLKFQPVNATYGKVKLVVNSTGNVSIDFYAIDSGKKISGNYTVKLVVFDSSGPKFVLNFKKPRYDFNTTPLEVYWEVSSDANISDVVFFIKNSNGVIEYYNDTFKDINANFTNGTITINLDASPRERWFCINATDIFGIKNETCASLGRFGKKTVSFTLSGSSGISKVYLEGKYPDGTESSFGEKPVAATVTYEGIPDFRKITWTLKLENSAGSYIKLVRRSTELSTENEIKAVIKDSYAYINAESGVFSDADEIIFHIKVSLEEGETGKTRVCKSFNLGEEKCRNAWEDYGTISSWQSSFTVHLSREDGYTPRNLAIAWTIEENQEQQPVGGTTNITQSHTAPLLSLTITPTSYETSAGSCQVLQFLAKNMGNASVTVAAELETSINTQLLTVSINPATFKLPALASKSFTATVCPQSSGVWDLKFCIRWGTQKACKTVTIKATAPGNFSFSTPGQEGTSKGGNKTGTQEKNPVENITLGLNVSVRMREGIAEVEVKAGNSTVPANVTVVYPDGSKETFQAPTGRVTFVPKSKRFKVIVESPTGKKEVQFAEQIKEAVKAFPVTRVAVAVAVIVVLIAAGVFLNARFFL